VLSTDLFNLIFDYIRKNKTFLKTVKIKSKKCEVFVKIKTNYSLTKVESCDKIKIVLFPY